ncbi:hypothetical protein K2O51_32060 (plasmid) [Cupriavidus pinatubonensis]|uniref:hypothetical protein n=1 Tax=Cupriavidus pinatubonensis TaxID=248026 RepID=UPI001C73914D|nr:hypothetical protein [Cupriavidus pinatubonensis]QYY34023.1 hypothetical protein K2O51_32060 [Cupriavidus pinatubonensis]
MTDRAAGRSGGWRMALAAWAVPAIAAVPMSRAVFRIQDPATAWAATTAAPARIWRVPLAWHVTLFMGLQSSMGYIVFGWMPSMLQSRGLDPGQAGALAGLSIIVQAPVAMAVSTWAGRVSDHRAAIAAASLLCPAAVAACMVVPETALVVAIVPLGVIQGSLLALGLTTIGMRSGNASVAAQLSGMSQGIGYAIAALGPAAAGLLHARSGGWTEVLWLYGAIGAASAVTGMGAGRPRMIGARLAQEPA